MRPPLPPRLLAFLLPPALLLACPGASKPPVIPGGDTSETDDDTHGDTDGDPDDSAEPVPSPGTPWVRDEQATPGPASFTEVSYNPPDDDGLEWIEVHSPLVFDLDVSGWSLDGGISFRFPSGTRIAAGGWIVVAADPALLAEETGFDDALGPWTGRLDNGGERVDLRNNVDRLIDSVAFGDDDPWPVGPDGSGFTLAKVQADAASDHAENWSTSATLGGTPGAANGLDPLVPPRTEELLPLDATWRYDDSGEAAPAGWTGVGFDDGAWPEGEAVFYAGEATVDVPATVRITADNYYGVYLGESDGTALRLVGQDADGDWTTAEAFDVEVGPRDHLYVAAWEAPWDSGGPQMTIAQVELPDAVVGTDAEAWEWVLGPDDGCPGTTPPDPPPSEEEILAAVDDAEVGGTWDLPAVEADRSSDPWGWALSGSFDASTRYVWPDTFGDVSVTNTANTWALFRSRSPLQAGGGTTEIPTLPTTTRFRTSFVLDADPAATALFLDCVVDDGAIFYLNGVEVLRHLVPDGPVDVDTLASAAADDPDLLAELPADALLRGENVLSAEVHQAAVDDDDLAFGCALVARISSSPVGGGSSLLLNEVSAGGASRFQVELVNPGATPQSTAGLVLATSTGGEVALAAGDVAAGDLLLLDDVDLSLQVDDVLFLYSADRTALLDAVRVQATGRARFPDGGSWRVPGTATPGDPNDVELHDDIVIHEILYHAPPVSRAGEPYATRSEEWIELLNRGSGAVDLGGWQLVDAVAFSFPEGTVLEPGAFLVVAGDAAALRAAHPDLDVVGDFSGRLDNEGDRILLLDAAGNPADEVRYHDDGRWPEAADGGGASLELRDPWADNAVAEAWAASDEAGRAAWTSYEIRGVAEPSVVGPDGTWEELVIGLLDAGEVLIDDLSVVQDPDGAAVDLVQDGTFDGGGATWRLLGNHRHSEVVPDPDDPANPVLRLVATGPTGHMHNHAETTLRRPVRTVEYAITFRARPVWGSNQLHTRLYFNRMPTTTLVAQPDAWGTPGAPNSTAVDDLGPTFADLSHDPAVPAAGEPVLVTVTVQDPDGVSSVTLWSSVEGGAFQDQPMTEGEDCQWEALLDGQAAGTLVQFWVSAVDDRGVEATFPAAGPDSRALLRFDDGKAETNGLHNFRILLTPADSDWLHEDVNLMSDDLVGATVIYEESQVFYDVGVRLKGSERGRPEVVRLGYAVRFSAEQPFRGSHTSVLLDRSQGVSFGQREVLLNLVMTGAGSVSGEYNDLVQALTPLPEHTGPAELQLDRFSGLVLASQFADGDAGSLFEYELIYYPYTTDDGTPEGLKLPQPDGVVGTAITDLGDDKEAYRWNFLLQGNEREDDFEGLLDLCHVFALPGPAFLEETQALLDVDQWLRAFAFASLSGAVDQYGGDGAQHNAQLYVRPEDGRVLYFPHDLDYFGGSTMGVVVNGDLSRLLQDPANRRTYYGHLEDILSRTYNSTYLAPWCDQLGALLPDQDFAYNCAFIADRADWVLHRSSEAVNVQFPPQDFAITTNSGADFSVDTPEAVLEGTAWIDVRQISLAGAADPLAASWVDETTWQVTLPLVEGPNEVTLVATDFEGLEVGSDAVVVTMQSP